MPRWSPTARRGSRLAYRTPSDPPTPSSAGTGGGSSWRATSPRFRVRPVRGASERDGDGERGPMENDTLTTVTVVRFRPALRDAFERLNRQWIEQYFSVEEPDRAVFGDPEGTILRPGGEIFFVLSDEKVVGTCAMVPHGDDAF